MPPQRARCNVYFDYAQLDALRRVKERDGILPAEQIRRGIDLWLARMGMKVKAERKRAATKRS